MIDLKPIAQRGEFAGITATGRAVRVPLCVVYDLDNDRIKRGSLVSVVSRRRFPQRLVGDRAGVPVPACLPPADRFEKRLVDVGPPPVGHVGHLRERLGEAG